MQYRFELNIEIFLKLRKSKKPVDKLKIRSCTMDIDWIIKEGDKIEFCNNRKQYLIFKVKDKIISIADGAVVLVLDRKGSTTVNIENMEMLRPLKQKLEKRYRYIQDAYIEPCFRSRKR